MDEIIAFSVLFNDKARASTLSYTKAYEIHLGMFQRSLRQIIYTELHRQYMAAEEFAAQTQARNLILAFQRGLRHIAQWDENQMQRFMHGVSVGSAANHLFRMPGDLLQTLSNLVHMLMFTNTDVIDLVENRLTHCPGFAINTETTIGEFVVKCMKEAALHFDSTPFLFSRAEKPQHWIENRQKIMQQIDAVVSMVVHEMATNIVTSVCQKLMYQVREPKTMQSATIAATMNNKQALATSVAAPDDDKAFQIDKQPFGQHANSRNPDHYGVQQNATRTALPPAHSADLQQQKQQKQQQQQAYRQQPVPVSGGGNNMNSNNNNMYNNNNNVSRKTVPYSSSSTEQNYSGPGEKTLYTDRRLLSGHATDQDYLEHAYRHGALRHTSTPLQPSKMRDSLQANLTSSSTTAVDIVADEETQFNNASFAPRTTVPIASTTVPSHVLHNASSGRPISTAVHPTVATANPRDATNIGARADQTRPISQSGSQTQGQHISPTASTVAAAIKTQPIDAEAQRSEDKTYSSNNLTEPTTVVTLVVDESGETARDNEPVIEAQPETVTPADCMEQEAVQRQPSEAPSQPEAEKVGEPLRSVASAHHVVLENSESRPKPNEAQPLPLMHEKEDAQECDNSVSL